MDLSLTAKEAPRQPIPIELTWGYKNLLKAVEHDEAVAPGFHNYRAKLDWAVARARHYAERTGLQPEMILDAWETKRTYWYMNFYQESNFPEIKTGKVKVFDTCEDLAASIGNAGFRCPLCEGVSKSPYECDTGLKVKSIKGKGDTVCDWKVYGLFGHLGKGIAVFVRERVAVDHLFMPLAWEQEEKKIEPINSLDV